ncbi:hypothetical protein AO1008_09667 [Aspergillus oryzae 100-8]|uniref:C6 transcription factor n=1 Tax=Aspergillus oryzae (strain 3.042) TaxID=1160506 RepID=I8IIQ5_ASPO3|nr:hypothetical protein Ao3042_05229 [Aspergillus oryzae 3.042]KDE83101.1 hypothetical protein AO1008_09667 [Aspergillus oryzae 100-8]|eukprot:EIT78571.1 hypothetical protein Ao3042_05229 [Aspergillus oryzae 3.042]
MPTLRRRNRAIYLFTPERELPGILAALQRLPPHIHRHSSRPLRVRNHRHGRSSLLEEEDWDVADMCLDHCDRILNRLPGNGSTPDLNFSGVVQPDNRLVNPAAISLPETQTNNDIVDDMMSISGTFGTMDGFPFDMTGIWDVSVFQDVNLP